MSDFLERLQKEKVELEEKTTKLSDFLFSGKEIKLSDANLLLLHEQHIVMQKYLNILIIRIELLTN